MLERNLIVLALSETKVEGKSEYNIILKCLVREWACKGMKWIASEIASHGWGRHFGVNYQEVLKKRRGVLVM